MFRIEPRWSPNYSRRVRGKISLIVLHSTEGGFEGAVQWLRNPQARASAHFVVPRDPSRFPIAQLVDLDKAAWHAGKSVWKGEENVNDFSIGIEMEHFDGKQDWPEEQLQAVAWLCAHLERILQEDTSLKRYWVGALDYAGHCDVALPKGRKVDPLGFPWEAFHQKRQEWKSKLAGWYVLPAEKEVEAKSFVQTLRELYRLTDSLGLPAEAKKALGAFRNLPCVDAIVKQFGGT